MPRSMAPGRLNCFRGALPMDAVLLSFPPGAYQQIFSEGQAGATISILQRASRNVVQKRVPMKLVLRDQSISKLFVEG